MVLELLFIVVSEAVPDEEEARSGEPNLEVFALLVILTEGAKGTERCAGPADYVKQTIWWLQPR